MRREIQALRALAVILVVLFHLWPNRLTGGYIGVDVFFVISGFLITGHIVRDRQQRRSSFFAFWSRRVRRLLPAASLVLLTTLAATVTFLPERLWQNTVEQIGASAIGVENWLLAANSVDYFASQNDASAVQHYWSLSVEEQFYLIWPFIIVALLLISRSNGEVARLRIMVASLCFMGACSLAWSVVATHQDHTTAYFSTFTHGWEFIAGGVLALSITGLDRSRWNTMFRTRAVVSLVGFSAIILSAVAYTASTEFPGWVAVIPVAGTLLVIGAGESPSRIQRATLMTSRPVQFVGDNSYSTYLWHWPIIVILPFALGHPLGSSAKIAILVVSIALGWATRVCIEDPVRRAPILSKRSWRAYALLAASIAVILSAASAVWTSADMQARAAEASAAKALASPDPCLGAAAMSAHSSCTDLHSVRAGFGPDFAANDWGAIAGANKDGTLPDLASCTDFSQSASKFYDCPIGPQPAHPAQTLAIVGDSHALALAQPLTEVAQARGWAVRGILLNSCTPSMPVKYTDPSARALCNRWRGLVAKRIAADDRITTVAVTGFTRAENTPDVDETWADLVQGHTRMWKLWADTGKAVVVIGDVPLTSGQNVPDCVGAHAGDSDPCSIARAVALAPDPLRESVSRADSRLVTFVDLTDAFCDADRCHAVIGGLIAYRDSHHLSASFAGTLIPRLAAGIPR